MLTTLDMKELWGGNFALGYRPEGDVPFLRHQGELKGFTVETLDEPVLFNGEIVSSRRVRAALGAGELDEATACLGRYFCVRGPVVKGDQRGRTIGFPTANVAVWDELLLPANGVYATYIWVRGERRLAATNVGVRPTVDGLKLTVEAHILDFDADIYGEDVRLEFVRRVRPEMKFAGLDALKAQIAADVAEVRLNVSAPGL
ncbi:MAG TPA: riboflavin kinase [Promineifilum sp.]|nr:riboflavin kinase [Promineifilum sp.]